MRTPKPTATAQRMSTELGRILAEILADPRRLIAERNRALPEPVAPAGQRCGDGVAEPFGRVLGVGRSARADLLQVLFEQAQAPLDFTHFGRDRPRISRRARHRTDPFDNDSLAAMKRRSAASCSSLVCGNYYANARDGRGPSRQFAVALA
jgi:hypothetical protein